MKYIYAYKTSDGTRHEDAMEAESRESTAMTRHYYHENIDALKSAVAAIPTL